MLVHCVQEKQHEGIHSGRETQSRHPQEVEKRDTNDPRKEPLMSLQKFNFTSHKRMHSKRMRTTRPMTGRISWGGAYHACHACPPFCHACPPSPCMLPPRHACPLEQPRMPLRATMHTSPGATMHAPLPDQSRMPPSRINHT